MSDGDALHSAPRLVVTRSIDGVTLTAFTWRASVLQYDSWALLWTVGILYFITPFTICLPIVWKTHIYPAVWADCNMFREYSNTPYLAGSVGLLVLFQRMFPFKMIWLFPPWCFCLLWKCFFTTRKRIADHREQCRPVCWRTMLFYPFWQCT